MFIGVALVGTLMGQLVFGYFGDKLGRKRVYGITLFLNGRVILRAYSFEEIIQTKMSYIKKKEVDFFRDLWSKKEKKITPVHSLNMGRLEELGSTFLAKQLMVIQS
jgi:hypothetical protein